MGLKTYQTYKNNKMQTVVAVNSKVAKNISGYWMLHGRVSNRRVIVKS